MTDKELFDALVKQGSLSEKMAQRVLRDAKLSDTLPEDLLYSKRLVDEEVVAKAKSVLLDVPYVPVDVAAIPQDVFDLVPQETSHHYRIVPLSRKDNMLTVGMLRPHDEKAQEALRFIAKRDRMSVGAYLVTPSVLEKVWRRYAPFAGEIERAVKAAGVAVDEKQQVVSLEEALQKSEEAPIIKIVASSLRHAVELKASDAPAGTSADSFSD